MKKLLFILLLFISQLTFAQVVGKYFTYNFPVDEAHTSAGVFFGGKLIRTLWSDIPQKSGNHQAYWDGKDDNKVLKITGTYQIKISSNNNTYTWEGVIGNSSQPTFTGATVWKGGTQIADMARTGSTTMRVATGFSEGAAAQCKFSTTSVQQKTIYSVLPLSTGQQTSAVCANATYVFYGGFDYFNATSFIFGETLSNEHEASFTTGVATSFAPPNRVYSSALLLSSGIIGGMDIQQGGNQFLVVTYPALNLVKVLKMGNGSGTVVQNITLTSPGKVTFEDDNDLWIAQGTTVTRYTMNGTTGALTATASQITGLSNACGISVLSGDLAILDGGNQQILKRYNSTTLAPTGTIGQVGGYMNTVTVSNDRFALADLRGQHVTFVRHQADGSIWIGDSGNLRCQHFASNGTFIESIMYIPLYCSYTNNTKSGACYNVNLVYGGSPNSVFNELLEFNIDYSQPIGSGWTLINNYNYNLPTGWDNTGLVSGIARLSNGRRYAIVTKANGGTSYMAELTSTGLRINNVLLPQYANFTRTTDALTAYNKTNTNVVVPPAVQGPAVLTYFKYPITGFDVSNNIILGSSHSIIVNAGYTNPLPQTTALHVTASHKLIVFDNTIITGARDGSKSKYFHLAAFDSTSMSNLWSTRIGTYTSYQGDLPLDAGYDIGNSVKIEGGGMDIVGNNIVTNDRGEGWRNLEISMFHHYDDNGLLQSQQGVVGLGVQGLPAPFGYFPNCLRTSMTLIGGKLYLYFSDESSHAGVHRWKIDNLSSYLLQTVNFTLNSIGYVSPVTTTDLLTGIGTGSLMGAPGWTQNPATDVSNFFSIGSIGNQDGSPSIQLHDITLNVPSRYWKRTLPVPLTYWTIGGNLDFARNTFIAQEPASLSNPTTVGSVYIELGDGAGKVISRLYLYHSNRISFNKTYFGPFNNPKYSISQFRMSRQGNKIYLAIKIFGVWSSILQPLYDGAANIGNLTYISFHQDGQINSGFQMGVNKLYVIN